MAPSDRVRRANTGTPARLPDAEGAITRDGVRVHWESYGSGSAAVLLLPTWSVVHSRHWKGQIPFLARSFRVVTFDGRGNGLSDRPLDPAAYAAVEFADDAAAVLDAAEIDSACIAGLSLGSLYGLHLAARHPERVRGALFIGPSIPFLSGPRASIAAASFTDELETYEGWEKYNLPYWLRDWRGFLQFFFAEVHSEPHSTKQIEDAVAWGLETTPEIIGLTEVQPDVASLAEAEALCRGVRCPVVVVQGSEDRLYPTERAVRIAELTGGELVVLEGSGHAAQARDPVEVNVILHDLIRRACGTVAPPRTWARGRARQRRALVVSSPIGLGHAWRDVAVVDELRRRVPGLEVEWLAQHPVTAVLQARGERIHPASAELAKESDHIDSEAGEHELNAFQALRRLDEIFVANFMLFHDVARDGLYDLWIGDEAWEVDYYLHENPERKTAAYAWLTDFVGFVPLEEGGEREAILTSDLNAEMIEQVERYPRVRDRAIFVGEPPDVWPGSFGPGLPAIRPWVQDHYAFSGYIPSFDAAALPARPVLRQELGWDEEEPVCVVAVGGSGAGSHLLQRVCAAAPALRNRVPDLRLVAVAGPRIDPASLPAAAGLEVLPYVHELYRHFAACDVAIVQGGLTTTMELVALRKPFLAVPLGRHFEQRVHVRHRLDRHGACSWAEYADLGDEALCDALAAALRSPVRYRTVPVGGASRAAELIAELL